MALIEVRIQNRLDELGITCQHLSALDGCISNSRLSESLRGLRDLSADDAARLLKITARLLELRDSFAPLVLNWRNPTDTRWLLDNLVATNEEVKEAVTRFFKTKHQ